MDEENLKDKSGIWVNEPETYQNREDDEQKCDETCIISQCNIKCHCVFPASFPHTALVGLQPEATLDLVLNKPQSNSNPQIGEDFGSSETAWISIQKPDNIAVS